MGQIEVAGLGKAYREYPSRLARVREWFLPFLGPAHALKWVLREISFRISAGEAVGIIGMNGAGKSTLLKMVTGTVQPTRGQVKVLGRLSALLELGMGFHPDFTGRQNVFMAGQLLGLTKKEIASLMPEIESFAGIGAYIDKPVRVYSTGMQVRLAFSVATAKRPDILIVDEALAVGDAYFQHKSFDRIKKFRDDGTTLLFVSHSPGAIRSLCDRAILLDSGTVQFDGAPDVVLDYYNALIAKRESDYEIFQAEEVSGRSGTLSGNFKAQIDRVDLLVAGKSVRAVASAERAIVQVVALAKQELSELTIGILIKDRYGNDVFGTNTAHHQLVYRQLRSGSRVVAEFDFPNLFIGPGDYSLTVALHAGDNHIAGNYEWRDRALVFKVVPGSFPPSAGVCTFPVNVICGQAEPQQDI